ncbi:plasminogen activator inhibitor 1 RNA-binding protein-like [Anoplophora glabripennis]|uniref:plasminogen activator inhibitor 1 RNA-binding protein-like n=1 Tax=Anoplophora glabripennis TaxID=217634 RepID=UPI000873A8C5|nr:plasminogen activator inhibitor 1 RNA-binding protein-like [Anoplophora glabripennis]
MAEAEQSDKNIPASHRRPYHQNRPGSSYRGRGRANASVSKALHFFGVRDLREILDRKHQDEDQTKSGPPPDPSYNYLKDPSRENANEHQSHRYRERISGDTYPRGHYFRGSRGRGRGGGSFRENRQYESDKPSFIQNPVNIKVEVIASTGERNCQLDEETKIADIKHIPNYKLKDLRPRNEDGAGRDFNDRYGYERGRGRGQRGRRGRGRGERGRGRGQGRQPNRNNESDQLQQQTSKNASKEKSADTPVENEEGKESGENHEEDYTEDPEQEDEGPEQYYEGEEESWEVNEQNQSLDEAAGQVDIKLDENLVVTSSENEEKRKRTVQFKLDDTRSDQAAKEDLKKEERDVKKDTPLKEEDKKLDK